MRVSQRQYEHTLDSVFELELSTDPGSASVPAPRAEGDLAGLQRFSRRDCIFKLRAQEPVGSVRLGERFIIETTNAFGAVCPTAADLDRFMLSDERMGRSHPCSGPIHVVGVTQDASLVIKVERVVAFNAMSCLSTSSGFLRGRYPGRQARVFEVESDGFVRLPGVLLRSASSIGTIATLDAIERSAGRTSENGGNMDIPYFGAGSSVCLPVNHATALFAVGDVHLRQGLGEAPGMGIEADGEIVVSTAVAEKLPFPLVETAALVAVIGWGATLEAAAERAVRNAVAYMKRLKPFSTWSDGAIYQLLGGFDLVPGNATGRVATCAQTLRKRDLLDPISRRSVVLGPRRLPATNKLEVGALRDHPARFAGALEPAQAIAGAVQAFETLEVLHDGCSRQIRALPDDPTLVISVLKPSVYSFRAKGPVRVPGTELVRAQINSVLCRVLEEALISTTTVATLGAHVLMRKAEVATSIEVVLKTRFVGSPKHRYRNLGRVPTRAGGALAVGDRHEPYVRFDWRNEPPDEDEVLPEGLAGQFIEVDTARCTVLSAHRALQKYLAARELDLVDGCFFLSQDGRSICGEVSPDNLTLEYTGRDAALRQLLAQTSKESALQRWAALARTITRPLATLGAI